MAISTSSSFVAVAVASPNFYSNSKPSSQSISTSVRFGRSRISAGYATAERSSTATETIRSFRSASPSSLYDVLGIRIGADTSEVKAAYRRLARVLHPDVGSGDSSADEFMKVHSAYITLVDPEKRADYDRSVVQLRAGGSSPMRSGGGYRSRRWETDQCW
ncbi:chaperone protein dnaJ 11, chloroplastic-like [Cynara cardunculus var. scolymus]|uniref:chaperone protein dnaJ 11, chloroplastic-like n=1 Tax=Cynara cardunculus var. scolymus TaxID=59895 RepID=UPI000D62835F|nr:chaperone protein dnaJ 11, chloroplastic-like [Cynara cardunculus var. scolymus]